MKNQFAWKLSRLPRVGAGFLALAIRARPKGVKTCSIWGTALVQAPLARAILADFLEPALSSGRFVAAPEPLLGNHSLHDIPKAMALLRRGVSARNVFVTL